MTREEMQAILAQHLAKFRTWTYAELAERIESNRQSHNCLEHVEGQAPDGTTYLIEFNVFWDAKPHGNIRMLGDLSANPQKPLLGILPIYFPDVADSFIMRPDGTFVGE